MTGDFRVDPARLHGDRDPDRRLRRRGGRRRRASRVRRAARWRLPARRALVVAALLLLERRRRSGSASSPWLAGRRSRRARRSSSCSRWRAPALLVQSGAASRGPCSARDRRRRPLVERLGYSAVWVAPRAQLAELEQIGKLYAGDGPALMTEYQPYGVRHFLRKLDAEGASELRVRPVPLVDGSSLEPGHDRRPRPVPVPRHPRSTARSSSGPRRSRAGRPRPTGSSGTAATTTSGSGRPRAARRCSCTCRSDRTSSRRPSRRARSSGTLAQVAAKDGACSRRRRRRTRSSSRSRRPTSRPAGTVTGDTPRP